MPVNGCAMYGSRPAISATGRTDYVQTLCETAARYLGKPVRDPPCDHCRRVAGAVARAMGVWACP